MLFSCAKLFPRRKLVKLLVLLTLNSLTTIVLYRKYRNIYTMNSTTSTGESVYKVNRFLIRENYTILANFIKASLIINDPEETVTYIAHGEYPYLDNVIRLVGRWSGPISISVFAPGSDFHEAVHRINFLRNCVKKPEIKQLVSFHIFFPDSHVPSEDLFINSDSFTYAECPKDSKLPLDLQFGENLMEDTYRKRNGLMYPINLGRNIAQEEAKTKYVLGSDLELYPSPRDLIPKFLKFVKNYEKESNYHPTSYVLPVFEVEKTVPLTPSTKTDLKDLYSLKLADFFHKKVCWYCHFPPDHEKWIQLPENRESVGVFVKIKRKGYRWGFWEPFSITLKNTPPYDERLMKEMFMDRVPREYAFCLLNYDYVVLDNAFLVHRPGIRENNHHKDKKITIGQYANIKFNYKSQYIETYGSKYTNSCYI